MDNINETIRSNLFVLRDPKYKDFISKLVPNVDSERIIGIRTPVMRKEAKRVFKETDYAPFLRELPHYYFEENNLHSFLIEQIKDYDVLIAELDRFLPFVDNWATCDSMRPKIFAKHKKELFCKLKQWLSSEHEYTVRFGIEMLMNFFLDEDFNEEALELVARVNREEYYIKMMVAWYFATALAKQYEKTIPFIEAKSLAPWTHNKTIQKAVESYRITDEQKAYLKSLKIK